MVLVLSLLIPPAMPSAKRSLSIKLLITEVPNHSVICLVQLFPINMLLKFRIKLPLLTFLLAQKRGLNHPYLLTISYVEERVFNSLGGHCHRLHHKLQTPRRCFGQPLKTLFSLYSCTQHSAKDGFIKAAF